MLLLVIGISHRTAPLGIRERFAINKTDGKRMLDLLIEYVKHGVVVATCNRTEIYTTVQNAALGANHIRRFLSDWSGLSLSDLDQYTYIYEHEAAVRHLFRVASGLDSMILGEDQILGQVKEAMEDSLGKGALGPALSRLFHRAIQAGKRARSETEINRHAASVSSAAVALAKEFYPDLNQRRVLVISAGEAGKLTSVNLMSQGAASVVVVSRTLNRAQKLANAIGGQALPFKRLDEAFISADIVITSTGAPEYILGANRVASLMERRNGRPVLIVDIAVPRDVDPAASEIPNVHLRNIDDLQAIADANQREREKESPRVEAIIQDEVERFMAWWRTLSVLPTIAALRDRAEAIRQEEVSKTLSRFQGLTDDERRRVDAMTRAIVKKILHDPLVNLKEAGNTNGYVEAVQDLFALQIDIASSHPE
ncbi:MAG: glutamyl-tRNA reductase [Dehalococcoidia bacterium]|nr:glutamyl-tRNA reductase [Dehalococcoidia bacterium]